MFVWKRTRQQPLLWQVDYNCINIGVQVLIVVLITTSTMIHSDQDGEFNNTIMDPSQNDLELLKPERHPIT